MLPARRLRQEWLLDPDVVYLNHGTVGATPRRVLAAQRALQDEIERQPATFLLRELADETGGGRSTRMRRAMEVVAAHLGADPDGTVFVDNATTGANAVLRSFPWRPGDEAVVTSLGYGGVTNAVHYATRQFGATVREITLPALGSGDDDTVDALVGQLSPSTRLVVIDHISATTALIQPISRIAAACHEHDVAVLVDAAHGAGAIEVDIASYGVDWYTTNLHKWMWVPRSSAVLWAAERWRDRLHPAVVSWGLDHGMAAEFDLPGTRDPSPHLTAPEALAMRAELGEDEIITATHRLAVAAGELLRDRWGVEWTTPHHRLGPMVTVPLPGRLGSTTSDAQRVRDTLLVEHRIEVPVAAAPAGSPAGLIVRVSCQVYNDLDDIERLAAAVELVPAA